jgi:hypothetical protein
VLQGHALFCMVRISAVDSCHSVTTFSHVHIGAAYRE